MSGTPAIVGVELAGDVNVSDDIVYTNILASIRRGHPQVGMQPIQPQRVCLIGGGPSLDDTFDELKQLYFEGAKIVTMNGAYQWCIDRNIRPSAQIVLDARPENARFLTTDVPDCTYLIASQCAAEVWNQVEGRNVRIWHAAGVSERIWDALNAYYAKMWVPIGHGPIGGTTVAMRAIALLRTLGYIRMDLFGIDSCFMVGAHHAYSQPENDADKPYVVTINPEGHPELARDFTCAPWHMKQLEDFLLIVKETGDQYLLNIHGDGLLAYALQANAQLGIAAAADAGSDIKE